MVFGVDLGRVQAPRHDRRAARQPVPPGVPGDSPLKRIFDTRSDVERCSPGRQSAGREIYEPAMADYWRCVNDEQTRRLPAADPRRLERDRAATTSTISTRAGGRHPVADEQPHVPAHGVGWEQPQEDKPWYTASGRLRVLPLRARVHRVAGRCCRSSASRSTQRSTSRTSSSPTGRTRRSHRVAPRTTASARATRSTSRPGRCATSCARGRS